MGQSSVSPVGSFSHEVCVSPVRSVSPVRNFTAPGGVVSTPALVAPDREYSAVKNGQRRLYETPAQKDAEFAMVSQFAYQLSVVRGYGLAPKTISAFEKIDYTLHAADPKIFNAPPSKVYAAVECKSHSHAYGTYNNYILDHKNWDKLQKIASFVPTFLLVGYTDGLYYLQIGSLDLNFYNQLSLHAGGRTDRNDPNDIILKVNFPIEYLRSLDVLQ